MDDTTTTILYKLNNKQRAFFRLEIILSVGPLKTHFLSRHEIIQRNTLQPVFQLTLTFIRVNQQVSFVSSDSQEEGRFIILFPQTGDLRALNLMLTLWEMRWCRRRSKVRLRSHYTRRSQATGPTEKGTNGGS